MRTIAEPFDWTFGRGDLDKLLARIDAHTARAASARCLPSAVMPISGSTRTSLAQRLEQRRRERWPSLTRLSVRVRGNFAYIAGTVAADEHLPLCWLRYGGSASRWGVATYLASKDSYEDSVPSSGMTAGSLEEALDCACGLYRNDPSAWTDARTGSDSRENF